MVSKFNNMKLIAINSK